MLSEIKNNTYVVVIVRFDAKTLKTYKHTKCFTDCAKAIAHLQLTLRTINDSTDSIAEGFVYNVKNNCVDISIGLPSFRMQKVVR